jgi:hypothetical protein
MNEALKTYISLEYQSSVDNNTAQDAAAVILTAECSRR